MARMRQIKPDFFLDDELDRLSEVHQKLFVGLWCLSDSEGKLFDNPKKIKAQIFPYRDYDADALLGDLHQAGFISRYEAAGSLCIKVIKFLKHQRPHPKEPALGLPDPPADRRSREKTRQEIAEPDAIPSRPGLTVNGSLENGSLENGEPRAEAPRRLSPSKQSVWTPSDPDKPRESWGFQDFEEWFQWTRGKAGFPPEKPIPIPESDPVWQAMTRWTGGAIQPICDGVIAYGQDPYWQERRPPLPLRGFLSQWEKYLPPREAQHARG